MISSGYRRIAWLTLALIGLPAVAIAQGLPADRFLVETDAPYLAPLPYRGKRNEPAYVVEVAKVLADVRGVSFEEICRQTTENFFRLFSKVPRAAAVAA